MPFYRIFFLVLCLVGASCQSPTPHTAAEPSHGSGVAQPSTPQERLKNQPKLLLDLSAGKAALHQYVETWCTTTQALLEVPAIRTAIANGDYQVAFKVNAFRNTDVVPPVFEGERH